jgi:CO/xanthine dehydrogenase FAD-binding subunit
LVVPVTEDDDTVAENAARVAEPWSDVRGTAAYKRRMIAEFSRRALRAARRRAGQA